MNDETSDRDTIFTSVSQSARHVEHAAVLWKEVYCDEFGWLSEDVDPKADRYHERSFYAVSWAGEDQAIGTLRIVEQSDPGFYITDKLSANPLAGYLSNGVEIQRLMVRKGYRDCKLPGAPFGVYGCLVKACFHYALAMGVDWVLADCHKNVDIGPLKSMKNMGFKETGHSYRDSCNDEDCVVLIIRTKDWVQDVVRRPSVFNRYLFCLDNTLLMEL